ncbi:hypothetical protein RhiirA1_466369 [Rhizophagus irregularis]|uniref:Uncharacterized protein n=1 Tax=Rhizophagus irregularis TaxID=588596 RepID=A0A2N0RE57_9GLOM|nr:hypothetical protein RhiirA1_466369 [Rhizophagus irregularis]
MSSYMIEHGFRRPPNMEMTPVDQLVIPETSQKKDKQKFMISLYLGPAKNISRVKTLGQYYQCLVKCQYKYQTLQVKIALSSFALSQFNKYWMTDLGGIPDMTMAALWSDHKLNPFLMQCSASTFKIIQTSKGRRKLVAYFENWETTLKVLNKLQFFLSDGKELKWCQYSIPNLKKVQPKLKAKNTLNKKKSGETNKASDSNKPKKKDKVPFSKSDRQNNNQSKNPPILKKTKNNSKNKNRDKNNKEILAEILSLLRKLV